MTAFEVLLFIQIVLLFIFWNMFKKYSTLIETQNRLIAENNELMKRRFDEIEDRIFVNRLKL